MADISKLNLGTGADLDLKDAYVRSLVPANADPVDNLLATMTDVGGGGGAIFEKILEVNATTTALTSDLTSLIKTGKTYLFTYGSNIRTISGGITYIDNSVMVDGTDFNSYNLTGSSASLYMMFTGNPSNYSLLISLSKSNNQTKKVATVNVGYIFRIYEITPVSGGSGSFNPSWLYTFTNTTSVLTWIASTQEFKTIIDAVDDDDYILMEISTDITQARTNNWLRSSTIRGKTFKDNLNLLWNSTSTYTCSLFMLSSSIECKMRGINENTGVEVYIPAYSQLRISKI